MADEKSEGGGSLLANPSALLALVTIAGGLWLVSQKLTSDRPVTPAGNSVSFLGDQKVEARLWEDPFRQIVRNEGEQSSDGSDPGTVDLNGLAGQIQRRSSPEHPSKAIAGAKPANADKGVLLLPVMLSGGHYSEDQESRIRSRFAIVSALGRSGYVPDDAEHVGALKIPWLTQQQMDDAKWRPTDATAKISRLWDDKSGDSKRRGDRLLGIETTAESAHLEVRYEWYRPRAFAAATSVRTMWPGILVLWLDDSYFEDDALLRLPLLLERLTDPDRFTPRIPPPAVTLIGPRRSSTLRNMLPDWKSGATLWTNLVNRNLEPLARKVLKRIDLYCATPSAMDEVLVRNPQDSTVTPRASVGAALVSEGFNSFHNFAATDAQLAGEVLSELALRGTDLTDPGNHVVLISEWDTFYARMLSLTYGAELAGRPKKGREHEPAIKRAEFVETYISRPEFPTVLPANFHSFVYLRGLDGQTVGGEGAKEADPTDRDGKSLPNSIEELRHWAPDVSKAEGQAQFDYLGRLGDQMDKLQKTLRREGKGEVKAIGIVGSDVYDTLLILQALRTRFPEVLFFTTDLDVRFCHPREREWARNLIVASSYGLELETSLQGAIAPFRDSTQTAQFAAALAALGNEDLRKVTKIPPRRFEVGNRIAVDLSMDSPASVATTVSAAASFRLHPMTASELYRSRSEHYFYRLGWGIVAAVLLLGGVIWGWRPLRQLTLDAFDYPGKALNYGEEDIGGPDGAAGWMLRFEACRGDPRANRLIGDLQILKIQAELRKLDAALKKKSVDEPAELVWERESALGELTARLLTLLNRELPPENPPARDRESLRGRLVWWLQARTRMIARHRARQEVDAFLIKVSPDSQSSFAETSASVAMNFGTEQKILQATALRAAVDARQSAEDLFRLRCESLRHFWISVVGFGLTGLGLVWVIWRDTFRHADGEPFSLTSGISAWPAQVLRLLVFALAVRFSFWLSHKVREAFFTLTRKFRLSASDRVAAGGDEEPCADSLWQQYRQKSLSRRWPRITFLTVGYLVLLTAISLAFGESILQPVRGNVIGLLNYVFLFASIFGFLALAFLTVDAATLCRGFIEGLNKGPTSYPEATRQHFSRQMGRIKDEYLDEWIDLQLIAELTERVGRMVYYPAALILLLFLARNSWWDCWSWPVSLIIVFASNFILALASVVILQRAAKDAKRLAEQSLAAKVKKLQAQVAPSAAQNNASQAEKLLDEIRHLDRGAFVPFWENPVVGAVFLSSGGTTLLQVFIWFMGR